MSSGLGVMRVAHTCGSQPWRLMAGHKEGSAYQRLLWTAARKCALKPLHGLSGHKARAEQHRSQRTSFPTAIGTRHCAFALNAVQCAQQSSSTSLPGCSQIVCLGCLTQNVQTAP